MTGDLSMIKKYLPKLMAFIILMIYVVTAHSQQNPDVETKGKTSVKNVAGRADDAYGRLNQGELINVCGNYGTITDTYLQNVIYNFTWPKSKGAETSKEGSENAADDFSFFFATNSVKNLEGTGTVIDGYTNYDMEDWRGVDGANGRYHCALEEQRDYLLAPDGTPMMATSDLPESWPAGWMDDKEWPGTWHPGPTGPYNELSKSDQALVDSMGAWYDELYNVWRFWPGNFRVDPKTGKEVPGEFAGDRHVWCIMDDEDNLQGPQVGIVVTMEGISYGRPYAEDFQFYDFTIRNVSGTKLDSCWWGYYVDPKFCDVYQEQLYTYNSGINPNDKYNVFIQYDPDGQTVPNRWREIGVFGMAVLRTPKDLGVTDAHFQKDIGTGSPYPADDWELWAQITSNKNDPYVPLPLSDFFHGPDDHLDDFSLTWGNTMDYAFILGSGPFSMEPDEVLKATIVVSAGEDQVENMTSKDELQTGDFATNISIAQDMLQANFQGPKGPPAPNLYGVPGDGKVTLYWDDAPELKADPFSGELDFEGYKIYRSVDAGASWGNPVTNATGQVIGYVPLAQFDNNNDFSGVDPVNTNNYLGDNTGLKHVFIDSTVNNGVVYTYTITAYDRGDPDRNLPSYESARGTSPVEKNVVEITPHSKAIGYVDPAVEISDYAFGNGELNVTVYEQPQEEKFYQITFVDSPATVFNVMDEGILRDQFPINSDEDLPTVDGIRFQLDGDTEFGGVSSVSDEYGLNVFGAANLDTTRNWYVEVAEIVPVTISDFDGLVADYEIRFSGDSSWAAKAGPDPQLAKIKVPFTIWRLEGNEETQVNCLIAGTDLKYDLGDFIYIGSNDYRASAAGDTISANWKEDFAYRININASSQNADRTLPLKGQKVLIRTSRAFNPSDYFEVRVSPATIETDKELLADMLDEVRVVPNPYVVNADWETEQNVRRLRFMFLPAQCDISIYTAAGEKVAKLRHDDGTGDEEWNLLNYEGQEVAYGLYLYVIEAKDDSGNKVSKTGKFIIIK